ncbi:hypothetical protein ABPG72_015583 [Tetrahymena utriculariae]
MNFNISERNSDATLYVGGLDQKVTQEVLWELFSQCGIVINVHLPRDKITGEHQGYGFVEYKSEEDADYAIKILHLIKLYSKPIKVNKASQDKRTQEVGANVFIGNLDPSVTEMQLQETFSTFGLIIGRRIVHDSENNQSKGYAFISYDNFESSDNAISAMNGQYYGSQKISVQYAFKKDSKGERHGSAAERLLAANRPQPLQSGMGMNAPAPLVPSNKGINRSSIPMAEGLIQPNPIVPQNAYGQAPNFAPPMQGYSMPQNMPPNMPPPPMYMPQQMPPGYPPLPPNMPPPPMGMPPLPPGQYMPPPPGFMPPNMPNLPIPPRLN